jgi:ubiquinone/menaquinone biosynthesis C-methylase UbiE
MVGIPNTATEDETRRALHGMWASVAPGWSDHADDADARGALLTARMLDAVALARGERVLELACGPGGAGLAAAERVGPTGEVVLSDVVPEMTAIAAERAGARGLTNVRTAVLDLEEIDQTDAAYDVVVCREGLMFATDPARAACEMRRVLRPGGRVAVAVWGARARNPWLAVILDGLCAQLGVPVPPPGIPGPFTLDDPSRVLALFSDAGLSDVDVVDVSVPLHADTFEAWWSRTSALAGPVSQLVAALPDDARGELLRRLHAAVKPYETESGLEFPGTSLLATAHR